jgi:hypothetical protein
MKRVLHILQSFWRPLTRYAGVQLFFCALVSAAFSVPALHATLKTTPVTLMLWAFFVLLALLSFASLLLRRVLSTLFHSACLFIIIGAWLSAYHTQEVHVTAYGIPLLADETSEERIAARSFLIDEQRIFVRDFQQEYYPHHPMPKQWRTTLHLPDGRTEVTSVNHPVRYNGWTIYQMSFGIANRGERPLPRFWSAPRGYTHMNYAGVHFPYHFFALDYHEINGPRAYPYYDPVLYAHVHGEKTDAGVYYTGLLLRRDPGVPWTFTGYGLLILAALILALKETVK